MESFVTIIIMISIVKEDCFFLCHALVQGV